MPCSTSDNSPLSEPNAADPNSALADRNTQRPQAGFAPLLPNDPRCILGFRSDASASELYDEASLRQHAALGLLGALSDTPSSSELASEPLSACIQAIRLLCSDAAALYSAAWNSVQQEAA